MNAILAQPTDNHGRADIALAAPDGRQRTVSSTDCRIALTAPDRTGNRHRRHPPRRRRRPQGDRE